VADLGFELRVCRPKIFVYNSVIIVKLNVI